METAEKPRVGQALLPDGTAGLVLWDAAVKMRAILDVMPDGSPRLTLHDAAGKVIWKAP